MRWSTSNPLMSWALLAMLFIIALVVILPDVDLPDTAFRSNGSPLAIRSLYQQVPQANANAGLFPLWFQPLRSTQRCSLRETLTRHVEDLPIMHESLRC